jgi:4a-hydroxytetrahydrobiopterin dehydratase
MGLHNGGVATLAEDEIRAAVPSGWELVSGPAIEKTFELPTFPDAVSFVDRIAVEAEAADHHPDLDIRYRKVRVALSTHSEGGVTQKDVDLATAVERVVGG